MPLAGKSQVNWGVWTEITPSASATSAKQERAEDCSRMKYLSVSFGFSESISPMVRESSSRLRKSASIGMPDGSVIIR